MTEVAVEENKADERWCENGEDRYGEYGVIGAEQADETHYDDRFRDQDDDDDDDEEFGADGRIHFAKDKLYGRDKELAQCRELFVSSTNEASAVFFSGYSGSGKSRVVEEFVTLNSTTTSDAKPSIIFLRAKSEAMRTTVPFSSINGLFDNVDNSLYEEFMGMRHEIQETLGHDARLLLKIFPILETFLAGRDDGSSVGGSSSLNGDSVSLASSTLASNAASSAKKKDTKKRMMLALQFFFRTLSSRSKRRLCIFLDDLQWVDALSMELIEAILTDSSIKNLFFFGGYRSNEVDEGHILAKKLQEIKEKREEKAFKGHLSTIDLKDLQKEAIGQFIADSLRLDFEEALPLTNVVFTKTLGNPFYTRQALEYLVLKNALYYDTISFRWDWKLQEKELKDLISGDLLEMIKAKIEHLEPKLQEVLMTASCTRSTFDVDTILVLLQPKFLKQGEAFAGSNATKEEYEEEKKQLVGLLNQAVVEGLLEQPQVAKSTSNPGEPTEDEYAFAHDKIRETARGLISSAGDEFVFLERVGNILSQRAECAQYGEDWMLFAACEHLNRVSNHYKTLPEGDKNQEEKRLEFMDKEKQFRLAVLNLRTAEVSIDLLAFPAALDFCEHGISYLPSDEGERWSEKYHDTTLHLYSIASQAEYGVADVNGAERYCNLVLNQRSGANPKVTTTEAIPVILIYLDVLGDKGEKEAALELCLQILREFGVSVPKSERMLRGKVWWNLKQIKSRHFLSEESVQNMPQVSEPIVANKMELMKKASSLAFSADQTYLYMLLNCESVKLISQHGLTESSAASIASFANVLMHVYNDFATSPKLAELAIVIADRQQSKFSETQPLNTANYNVLEWVRPFSSCLKYHDRAYNSGIASGNLNGAALGKWFGLLNKLFSCCISLPELEGQLRDGVAEMRRNGQHFVAGMAIVVWQLTLNLIGKLPENPNTTVLTGEVIDENTELIKMPRGLLIGPWESFAFLFFGDFEAGAEDALKREDEFPTLAVGMMFGFEAVMRAIPLLIMARSDHAHKSKYRTWAMKLLKRVRRWVKNGCVNLEGPLQLMEAEYAVSKKQASAARSYFETAIASCRKGNFHHFAGLSCERYSAYLSEVGDAKGAKIYLEGAIGNYRRWGVVRKVEILKEKLTD